jgi:hypothetical protein
MVVAALTAAMFAFARSSGANGATAFALVDPNGGSPVLVGAHTSGFVSVKVGPFGAGDYCLTPAPGIDVVHTAAVAAEEIFLSSVFGVAGVRYPTEGPRCDAGQLEVKTFDSSPALTDQIAFTVIVP